MTKNGFRRTGKGRQGGERWRGKLPVPEHAPALVRALIERANEQKTTLKEIAERSGLQYKTISEWRYRRAPNLPNFVAALNAIGFDLAVVPLKEAA